MNGDGGTAVEAAEAFAEATTEANLTAADSGKLLAHDVATCMILSG